MPNPKIMTADDVARAIQDGDTVAICASGGGLLEPEAICAAIEKRFPFGGRAVVLPAASIQILE